MARMGAQVLISTPVAPPHFPRGPGGRGAFSETVPLVSVGGARGSHILAREAVVGNSSFSARGRFFSFHGVVLSHNIQVLTHFLEYLTEVCVGVPLVLNNKLLSLGSPTPPYASPRPAPRLPRPAL